MFDDSSVALAVDPRCPTEFISTDEFTNRFWRWLLRPGVHFTPPFIVCLDKKTFEILGDTGILNWVFWDLECRLRDCHFSAVKLENSVRSTAEISSESRLNTDITLDAHVVLLKTELAREVCRDVSLEWWNSVIKGMTEVTTSLRLVRVRDRRVMTLPTRFAFSNLFQTVLNLYHSEFRRAAEGRWTWTYSGVPERHTAYQSVRSVVNQGIVFPIKPDGRRHIGILLPFADFGGVEKVAFNTAFELRQAGYVPHLVLFRVGDIHIPAQFQMVFESFLWVTSKGLLSWEGDEFNGTRLSWWSQHGDTSDVVGMLAWFDAVLNCQSSDAHGVMGELKRRAVLTMTHQHVVELSRHGRIGGHPVQAKAFEHSYAAILTCSRQLRSWFVAHGIPQEKLFDIDNAPSYRLADLVLDEIALDRASLSLAARPLRVLFAARLDAQKGLDRLVELIERTTTSHLNVEWRVVGKSIVEHDESLERLQLLVNIEAPVYSEDELTGLYRWADVIVLTSRYEGIPLTIIEAMRCGVIVLSTDAGAIGELIQTGINGFVVPQRNCVSDMVEILRHLSGDETLCRRISKGAIIAGRHRSWKQSLTEVIDFLDQQLGAVKRRRSARMQLRPPCGTSNY
jgi:glycosyltransferase involved in cell wall biosynthesis